jgi:hypothetical protein
MERVPSCGTLGWACMGSPPMSPVGQIETRNRSVYFELRKFPLNRDKTSAYWRSRRKFNKTRPEFPKSEKCGTDMIWPRGSPCTNGNDRWHIPEHATASPAQGTSYRGKRFSHAPCPHTFFVSKSDRTWANRKQITASARRILRYGTPHRRGKP